MLGRKREKGCWLVRAWILSMSLHHFQTEAPCPASKSHHRSVFCFLNSVNSHYCPFLFFTHSQTHTRTHTPWDKSLIMSPDYTDSHRWPDSCTLWLSPGLPASANVWQKEEKKGRQTETIHTHTDWVGIRLFPIHCSILRNIKWKKKLRMCIWLIADVLSLWYYITSAP